MNTTAQIEKRFPLKKLFYLAEIFMISFSKIYFFKDFKFLRKMQSSQRSIPPCGQTGEWWDNVYMNLDDTLKNETLMFDV